LDVSSDCLKKESFFIGIWTFPRHRGAPTLIGKFSCPPPLESAPVCLVRTSSLADLSFSTLCFKFSPFPLRDGFCSNASGRRPSVLSLSLSVAFCHWRLFSAYSFLFRLRQQAVPASPIYDLSPSFLPPRLDRDVLTTHFPSSGSSPLTPPSAFSESLPEGTQD